jgi:spermidine/putrescine transport system substrate-binding protein
MKTKLYVVALVASFLFLSIVSQPAMAQQKVLNILTWAGYNEDQIIVPFEKKYNCKVNSKNFSGDEQLITIWETSPKGTWDVVNPDDQWVELFAKQGKIRALDPKKYPLKDFFPRFQKFAQFWLGDKLYGVATRFGYYGIAFNTKYISKDKVESWKILWDPKYKGKVGIFDWYIPNIGNMGRYIGVDQPYDMNKEQLKKVEELLLQLKPNVGTIALTASDLIAAMANESVWLSPAGEWARTTLKEQGHPIEHYVPKEGSVSWNEALCITADTKNLDLAEKFVQWMASPEIQAKLAWAKAFHAATPNSKATKFLTPEQVDILRMNETGMELMKRTCFRKIPPDEQAWKDVWMKFKAK